MVKEHSAGAVVYSDEGEREYLVLHYESGHWSFPKGKFERDEGAVETAKREILEETGLEVDFLTGFRNEIAYQFGRGGARVDKKVEFFLARAKNKQVRLSFEHIGSRWLGYENAREQLTYENDREVLDEAEKFLSSY